MVSSATEENAEDICRAARIAELNDQLRTTGVGGQIMITRGVQALAGPDVVELVKVVAAFDRFEARNDPYGEHDFGIVDYRGCELMWKIDYYSDADLHLGSEDPANAEVTHRVLTIFLPEEY